jgi:hypothetical protein
MTMCASSTCSIWSTAAMGTRIARGERREAIELTAALIRNADHECPGGAGYDSRREHIGRVATRADGDENIAGLYVGRELFREDAVISGIVRPGRDEWHVIRQRHHTEARQSFDPRPLGKIAGEMRCGSRAAAVADDEDGRAAPIALKKDIDRPLKMPKWHGLHRSSQFLPVTSNSISHKTVLSQEKRQARIQCTTG